MELTEKPKLEPAAEPTSKLAPELGSRWCKNLLCPPEHEEIMLQKMESATWETSGTQGLSPLKWEGAEEHEGCYVVMGNSLSRKEGGTLDRPIERDSIVTIGNHRARVGAIMMVQMASANAYHQFLDAVGALPLGEWLLLLSNPSSGIFMAEPDSVTKVETASADDRRMFASDGQMTQLIRTMCRFDGARDGRVNVAILQPYASAMAALKSAAAAAKAEERKATAAKRKAPEATPEVSPIPRTLRARDKPVKPVVEAAQEPHRADAKAAAAEKRAAAAAEKAAEKAAAAEKREAAAAAKAAEKETAAAQKAMDDEVAKAVAKAVARATKEAAANAASEKRAHEAALAAAKREADEAKEAALAAELREKAVAAEESSKLAPKASLQHHPSLHSMHAAFPVGAKVVKPESTCTTIWSAPLPPTPRGLG